MICQASDSNNQTSGQQMWIWVLQSDNSVIVLFRIVIYFMILQVLWVHVTTHFLTAKYSEIISSHPAVGAYTALLSNLLDFSWALYTSLIPLR